MHKFYRSTLNRFLTKGVAAGIFILFFWFLVSYNVDVIIVAADLERGRSIWARDNLFIETFLAISLRNFLFEQERKSEEEMKMKTKKLGSLR